MRIKNIFFIVLFLFSTASLAATCPTVKDIKSHHLNGWTAYDSEENKPLSAERLASFSNNVQQFALAEWAQKGNEKTGNVHCFYLDKDGSNLEAFLTKENLLPDNHDKGWYAVTGALQCAASMNKCAFKKSNQPEHQLADNQ